MILSTTWLKDHINFNLPLEKLKDGLTGLGLEFNPHVLTRLDPTFIDLIAKGLNLNSESFRNAIQKVYNI